MTVYLVDFENVRSEGLRGVENINEGDKVVIFYSKNADAITFDVHTLLSKSRAEIETFRILRGGRNSLDFQLSTYLGYLVMENCYTDIVIISQDKGFLCATSFWEENSELCNAHIRLCKSIANSDKESSSKDEFEDGLTGKFIEKIEVKKNNITPGITSSSTVKKPEYNKPAYTTSSYDNNASNKSSYSKPVYTKPVYNKPPYAKVPYAKTEYAKTEYAKTEYVKPPYVKSSYEKKADNSTSELNNEEKKNLVSTPIKRNVKKVPKPNLNIQNATSKNKIFAAEVKLNVADDIKEIINGKYDEKVVPVLVETLGLSTGKQHFYRMLVSRLGQEQGHNIYMMIKGQYANLKRK